MIAAIALPIIGQIKVFQAAFNVTKMPYTSWDLIGTMSTPLKIVEIALTTKVSQKTIKGSLGINGINVK